MRNCNVNDLVYLSTFERQDLSPAHLCELSGFLSLNLSNIGHRMILCGHISPLRHLTPGHCRISHSSAKIKLSVTNDEMIHFMYLFVSSLICRFEFDRNKMVLNLLCCYEEQSRYVDGEMNMQPIPRITLSIKRSKVPPSTLR